MKKIILIILVFLTLLLSQFSSVASSKKADTNLNNYKNTFVGWINFDINQWAQLGFLSEEEWKKSIIHINQYSRSNFVRMWGETWNDYYLSITKLVVAKSSSEKPPLKADLHIKIDAQIIDVEIAKTCRILTTVQFIDRKSKTIVYDHKQYYDSDTIFGNFESKTINALSQMFKDVLSKLR